MNTNKNLNNSFKQKNNEYYTTLEQLKTIDRYADYFNGKIIYCNCDGLTSNFIKYFKEYFKEYNIKQLIATGYNPNGQGTLYVYEGAEEHVMLLNGNGSYDSEELRPFLYAADIIVTNPPFSIWKEYVDFLYDNKKNFLIIGSNIAVAYKTITRLYMKGLINNSTWIQPKNFITETGEFKPIECYWYSNFIDLYKQDFSTVMTKPLSECTYRHFDTNDILDFDRVKEIPNDYYGEIAVPTTINRYDYDKYFDLIGVLKHHVMYYVDKEIAMSNKINGKYIFNRFIIKRKTNN